MSLTPPQYRVLLEDNDGATTEHVATIRNQDQLRAEVEAPKHGLKDIGAAPLHFQTLWLWAALSREGINSEPFQVFRNRLVTYEQIEEEESEAAGVTADPTQLEDATASSSPSPHTSPESTGSESTTTG